MSPDAPDILKYFFEEPVYLEALSAETDPDARRRAEPSLPLSALLRPQAYYRGYLAGSTAGRVGLTTLPASAFVPPLQALFGDVPAWSIERGGTVQQVKDVEKVLHAPSATEVFVLGGETPAPSDARTLAEQERRYAIPSLRRVLQQSEFVAFPEPAHDGWDWSLFAPSPIKDRFVEALQQHSAGGVRRFVLPYVRARSEHKFYFERWALDDLPDWAEEV